MVVEWFSGWLVFVIVIQSEAKDLGSIKPNPPLKGARGMLM